MFYKGSYILNGLQSSAWEDIGFIGGELKYVAIKFRSVMKKRLPFSIGLAGSEVNREANSGVLQPARHRSTGHAT